MKKAEGKKKRHWAIYVLAVVALLVLTVVYFGVHNGKIMNKTVDAGIEALKESYTVTEADAGEFAELKLYGIMKFKTQRYDVEGLGNLCVMRVNIGLMQMSTFVLTPYEKNMPMLSTDFMYMFGIRKSYVEVYDLVADTQTEEYQAVLAALDSTFSEFSDLEDVQPGSGWYDYLLTVGAYKSCKGAQDDRNYQLFADSVKTYVSASEALGQLTGDARAEKLAITQTYSDTMVEKGGVSTSMFKKALGEDVTKAFFDKVFFGPANY